MVMKPWYKADPALYARTEFETLAAFPDLRFGVVEGRVNLTGPFRLIHNGEEIDRYEIEVLIPNDFPRSAPEVYETAGRIRRVADEHVYISGRVCLFVPGEKWRYWPEGGTLVDFLRGPVLSYFIGHAHYELTGEWPLGERSHGPEGVFEAYEEMLGTHDRDVIIEFLRVLAHPAPKGHWTCPCTSGRRLRDCHRSLIADLRVKITPEEAALALRYATITPGEAIGHEQLAANRKG
jgi:hypothetical protein